MLGSRDYNSGNFHFIKASRRQLSKSALLCNTFLSIYNFELGLLWYICLHHEDIPMPYVPSDWFIKELNDQYGGRRK